MSLPVARASMLIRRPSTAVFEAFADAATITRFWLSATSGPLSPGARVDWQFMVPGASAAVEVVAFEPGEYLAFDWPDLQVELNFDARSPDATVVTVAVAGFRQDECEACVDVTEGFSIVLCSLKLLLEQGDSGNLVRDKAELLALVGGTHA